VLVPLTLLCGEPAVDPGVDLTADPLDEGIDHRVLVLRADLTMDLGSCPDLVRRQ